MTKLQFNYLANFLPPKITQQIFGHLLTEQDTAVLSIKPKILINILTNNEKIKKEKKMCKRNCINQRAYQNMPHILHGRQQTHVNTKHSPKNKR